ncbi:hypothetical protein DMC30DRAFT_412521 [Rhodotorula diobovata]|uniref:Cation efflux family-domain-containing protein n=1 Tax=Rhodotorula diobovata TaxID=5288 RepID=A0A5C5FMF3_9BASI|nr:hypothetical protein DMC30DRAFT_412521 [Rhodotorula diobovata]
MQPLEPVREEDEGPLASTSTSTSTAAQHRAAAHPRQHSRIHERNLSAFFPRPGHATHGYGGTFDDPHAPTPFAPGVADIPSAPSPARATTHAPVGPAAGEASVSPPKTRRGHHHRHSVSHNLFPFLDSPSNPNGAAPGSRGALHSPTQSRTPTKAHEDQLPAPTASFRQRHGHLPLPLRLALFASLHIPLTARLLLALAFAQVVVGATLWVQGQAGESLAVTGLGYLVVFDGVGALSSVLLERDGALERTLQALGSQKDMSIRRPYGSARLVTLSHFSQAVYLLFSAVYVCKESVEHVLLLHGPQDADGAHGAGHGGVGHGEGLAVVADGHGDSISLPHRALFLAAVLATTLAVTARNHSGLSHALRRTPASRAPSSSSRAQLPSLGPPALLTHLANPFTATVLLFSLGLLSAAFVLPPAQLAPVDKVLALLESFAMFYVAQPAASATGQVLLQTSPGRGSAAVRSVEGLVQEGVTDQARLGWRTQLEALPAVQSVDRPHIWQLASSSPSPSSPSPSSPHPTLIATLVIHAHPHTTDADLLGVTRHARQRTERANERLRDRGEGEQVEVVVQVRRG